MELIKCTTQVRFTWYWQIDNPIIGFYVSKLYKSEVSAIRAAMNGKIKWIEKHPKQPAPVG